ncbi:MAG: transglycosylase SLT domain-containing protein [Deltaproteobacteria bacterium]|nr:transglycosylase SLT domain-containing protein [Deltaproteobacteria bacterium]
MKAYFQRTSEVLSLRTFLTILFISFVGSACSTKSYSDRDNIYNDHDLAGRSEKKVTKVEQDQNPLVLEEEFEAEQRGEIPTYDIPVVRNAKVEQWINYFQGRGHKLFHLYLERSGRYVPMMRKILRDHDLPEDLVYLSMIESGFSSRAFSRARAVGQWQFMRATGKLYGLKSDFWVDERRDPEKSSIAAARHLKDLYDQFQSWKLAAAAYNAGAAKVSRAIKRYKTEDFWEMTSKGKYLKPETRAYVPKMIAAALIAKEPAKYGFSGLHYQDPLEYEKIVLPEPVTLTRLAENARVPLEDLMALNPELNHPVTPPGGKDYELRVPVGTSEQFLTAYNSLSDTERFEYTAHQIRKNDNLPKLQRIYGVSANEILKYNGMKGVKKLPIGKIILIPLPDGAKLAAIDQRAAAVDKEERPDRRRRSKHRNVEKKIKTSDASSQKLTRKVHIVRRGESLTSIAERYGTSISEIKTKNGLKRTSVQRGQRLYIPSKS